MQFVVFGKLTDEFNGKPPAQLAAVLQGEYAKSREYYSTGALRHIWLFENNQGIMSFFEAESRQHMESLLADYPGIKEGFVTAEIRMIEPYSGFFPDLVR